MTINVMIMMMMTRWYDHHHEFRYVLSTDLLGAGFSSHWAPYWRSCTPCHFSYDIIMKVMVVLMVVITIGFTVQ